MSSDVLSVARTSTDALSGTIRWEVDKDSISKKNIYSPVLELGEIPWRIHTTRTPDGKGLSYFVSMKHDDYKVRGVDTILEYKLINHQNREKTITEKSIKNAFNLDNRWGFTKFVHWETLINKDEGFIKDNKITFQMGISITNIVGLRKLPRINLNDPNEPSHDLTLMVEGLKIYVNKGQLSIHSPVFHKMLYGEFAERNQTEIELKDIDYKEFIELLHVIYPPYKDITDENVEYLLKLGDRFQVDVVTDQCERYLIRSNLYLDSEKLAYAGEYRLSDLKEYCLCELKTVKDVTDLKNTDEFKTFTDEIHLALYLKIMQLS